MSELYKQAGVNIEEGSHAVNLIKEKVKATFDQRVLSGIGSFGAMFDASFLKSYRHPILVQSIDGVGTKIKVAQMAGYFDSLGEDIVNHCSDDILCQGARGITFLDYLAFDRLSAETMAAMVGGMAKACKEAGIALIGGETAEMPGVYLPGESDIAGCITGVVERDSIITGENIQPGDVLLGLPSSGLHTNGFSLARKVLFDKAGLGVDAYIEEASCSLAELLLRPHLNYAPAVLPLLEKFEIKGIAHLTGGGFYDNIPRVLPTGTAVEVNKNSWPELPIFQLIQQLGEVSFEEMHHVFNMGIGLVLVVKGEEVGQIQESLKNQNQSSFQIGRVKEGDRKVHFC